jgi:hypothetical protein
MSNELPQHMQDQLAKAVADFVLVTRVRVEDAVAFAGVLAKIFGEWFLDVQRQEHVELMERLRQDLMDRR